MNAKLLEWCRQYDDGIQVKRELDKVFPFYDENNKLEGVLLVYADNIIKIVNANRDTKFLNRKNIRKMYDTLFSLGPYTQTGCDQRVVVIYLDTDNEKGIRAVQDMGYNLVEVRDGAAKYVLDKQTWVNKKLEYSDLVLSLKKRCNLLQRQIFWRNDRISALRAFIKEQDLIQEFENFKIEYEQQLEKERNNGNIRG